MGVDVYETIEHFASQGRIAYVHLRNVRGTVLSYDETLIDDGDVNMAQALLAYQKGGYEGTFIPTTTPSLQVRRAAMRPWPTVSATFAA